MDVKCLKGISFSGSIAYEIKIIKKACICYCCVLLLLKLASVIKGSSSNNLFDETI